MMVQEALHRVVNLSLAEENGSLKSQVHSRDVQLVEAKQTSATAQVCSVSCFISRTLLPPSCDLRAADTDKAHKSQVTALQGELKATKQEVLFAQQQVQ